MWVGVGVYSLVVDVGMWMYVCMCVRGYRYGCGLLWCVYVSMYVLTVFAH